MKLGRECIPTSWKTQLHLVNVASTAQAAVDEEDTGAMKGRWSITVSGNWRMTFEFQDGNAYILDYEDYH